MRLRRLRSFFLVLGIASSALSGGIGNKTRAVELIAGAGCNFFLSGVFAGVGNISAALLLENAGRERLLSRPEDAAAEVLLTGSNKPAPPCS